MIRTRIKLTCIHYNECDPKKCTALKLAKFNLITIKSKIGRNNQSVVLTPFSQEVISKDDTQLVKMNGLTVIDCSWKKINNFSNFHFKNSRKLPDLIAVNPTNYGRWGKLSSVEALAVALYIVNQSELADFLLSKFSWGPVFRQINNLKEEK